MKKIVLLCLISLGLSAALLSSCSSVGGTAGNGTGSSYVKATEGSQVCSGPEAIITAQRPIDA